jgi:hypothetical protein
MVCTIPSYKPSFKFDENSEEGHPDPREVLFLIDPQQLALEEVCHSLMPGLCWFFFSHPYYYDYSYQYFFIFYFYLLFYFLFFIFYFTSSLAVIVPFSFARLD